MRRYQPASGMAGGGLRSRPGTGQQVLGLGLAPLPSPLEGSWRGALDLAGATLAFELRIARVEGKLVADVCNGPKCDTRASVRLKGDSVTFDIVDYDATVSALRRGDSL